MKQILFFVLSISFVVNAQQPNPQTSTDKLYQALKAVEVQQSRSSFEQYEIATPTTLSHESVRLYVKQHETFLKSNHTDLTLQHSKHSAMGWHFLYQQTFNQIPIHGAFIKINVNNNGIVLSVFNQLVNTDQWETNATSFNENFGKAMWVVLDNQPVPAYQKNIGSDWVVTDISGNQIQQKDTRLYFAHDDTLVTGKVFLPDPLTPISVISGQDGTYKHFNDSDYALLNDQRVSVSFPATFDGNVFRLTNQYARLYDTITKAPNIAPPTSTTPVFDFTRGLDGFKDVMALYHVTNVQQYLHSLGIDEVRYQLKIDAHSGTSDQSYFESQGDTTLNFGTGGVPDAEDADVIVHEFTHAVSFSINPTPNMANERRSIEEGMCDVMAAVYSQKYAPFNWRKLFNWDGPNPVAAGTTAFWKGRDGNSSKTYANISSDVYGSSEIWSSTMLDIVEQIGSDSAVMLMLATVANYTAGTTMPEAAQLFMQADSILLNKYFGWKIGPVFNARGMGNFPVGINEQQALINQLKLENSLAFAMGQGNARLNLPLTADVLVYDIQGKLMLKLTAQKGEVVLDNTLFNSGMYIVKVQSSTAQASLKLIKY